MDRAVSSVLEGLKRPAFALWIGLYRQLVAPVAFFWLATRYWDFGVDGIWAGVFSITWSAALVAVFYARRVVGQLAAQASRGGVDPEES
jgi:Na+-driven multidrug efflux pump